MKDIKKILCISMLYPQHKDSLLGIFVSQQMQTLRKMYNVDIHVICPIRTQRPSRAYSDKSILKSWKSEMKKIPFEYTDETGIKVYLPRFWSPPKRFFHFSWGFFCYMRIKHLLETLLEKNQYDVIFSHNAQPAGYIGNILQEKTDIPNIILVHGEDVLGQDSPPLFRLPFGKWAIGKTYEKARMVLTVTNRNLKIIKSLSNSNANLLHLGITPPCISRKREIMSSESVNIIQVGALVEQKGQKILVEAINRIKDRFPDIHVNIIGSGYCEGDLRKMINKYDLNDKIELKGNMENRRVFELYSESDIYIMASWNEGIGMSYLEAMSMGLPIIGTKGEGVEDHFSYGKIGILVPPQNPESLSDAISYMIENKEITKEMGKKSLEVFNENFKWEKSCKKLYDYMQDIIR